MNSLTAPFPIVTKLRESEAKTAATIREIDDHMRRLKLALDERQTALVKIRAKLALNGSAALDHHER